MEKGPIFATRFSKNGKYLLTASLDGTICVWDIPNKTLYEQHACHEGKDHSALVASKPKLIHVCVDPCLDAEWISDEIFASCGADGQIKIMKLGTPKPIRTLT